jgi:hypothetical protein
MTQIKDIKMEEMTGLRESSRKISALLSQELQSYVKSLSPLFSPRKVLGEFMDSANKSRVAGAEKNYVTVSEQYKAIMLDAFGHASKLSSSVPSINNKLILTPWATIETLGGTDLTMISPTRWVLGYDVNYNHQRLLQRYMAGEGAPNSADISAYVISQLVIAQLIDANPGIKRLFDGLNFTLSIETLPKYAGKLPFVVLTAPCQSFRPQDDLVTMASQFSGSTSFEELVSGDAVKEMPHAFQDKLLAQL